MGLCQGFHVCDASSIALLALYCFGYSSSFVVHMKFKIDFSMLVKNAVGILIGIALNR
jgi:hypothetical protein